MKIITAIAVATLCLCASGIAMGQQQTERFIPLGQSPGVSGKLSDIGAIVAFDAATDTLEVDVQGARRAVHISDDTRIWLDRSKQRLTNLDGGPGDLKQGSLVEVRYLDPAERRTAAWVKVEVDR